MGKFEKLIDVKSIVTLALTFVMLYLAVIGSVDLTDIYLLIIGFYFGTQKMKEDAVSGN